MVATHSRALRAQTTTHLTSKHLFHPSERRSRARRLHAVTSGSRARKAPRRWSPTPRGLPRLHGRLVVRAVSLRLTRTTHTARTRKTPASPSATGSPSTSSGASRIAIKFTLPQPHLRHLRDGSTSCRDPRAEYVRAFLISNGPIVQYQSGTARHHRVHACSPHSLRQGGRSSRPDPPEDERVLAQPPNGQPLRTPAARHHFKNHPC